MKTEETKVINELFDSIADGIPVINEEEAQAKERSRKSFHRVIGIITKQHAIEFAKHSCTESDTSEQRDKEWNEFYNEWITPK